MASSKPFNVSFYQCCLNLNASAGLNLVDLFPVIALQISDVTNQEDCFM